MFLHNSQFTKYPGDRYPNNPKYDPKDPKPLNGGLSSIYTNGLSCSLVRDIEKHETAYRKIRLDETKSKCQSPLERLLKRPSDIQKAEAEAAHQAWLDNLFVMDPGVNSMLTGVINKVTLI